MKTRKTRLLTAVMLVALGAALLVPQAVFAQQGGGTGTLTASGDGLAGLRGDGSITISGNGVLWIRDQAGDAVINVSGQGSERVLPNGWIRYAGFNGEAHVSGSAITVALSGTGIELEATGTGKFLLRGRGTYSTSGGHSGEWTDAGEVLSVAPGP